MSQLTKHNMPRTQGFQPLACSCASARRSRALCDLPPPDTLSYSVSKGWPNKSCIHLGKSISLGHRQSREGEYWTADFASSPSPHPFWLWYPWWEGTSLLGASPPPAGTNCAAVGESHGDWQGGSHRARQPRPRKARVCCCSVSQSGT